MKVACVLVICLGLFSAGHAQLSLDVDTLTDLGKSVLNTLVEQGKKVVVDAAKNALDSVFPGLGGILGKRDLSLITKEAVDLSKKIADLVDSGKALAGNIFADTLKKLKALAEAYHAAIGSIKDASGIAAHIDSVVTEHKMRQKRVVDTLIQTGKNLIAHAVDKVKDAAATLKQGASTIVSGLLQKGVDIFGDLGILGKRGLTDHLETISNVLDTVLGPLNEAVGNFGDTLKGHFSNLVDTVQGHANALKTKLDPHISDLKDHGQKLLDHGKNALGALSEVVSDILNQTAQNAGENLSGISKTLSDAGKTVVDHFTGDDSEVVAN